jgi:hypothetical protein
MRYENNFSSRSTPTKFQPVRSPCRATLHGVAAHGREARPPVKANFIHIAEVYDEIRKSVSV